MAPRPDVLVAAATPAEAPAVRAVIVRGLAQRWHQFEPALNPDLEAFGEFYAEALVLVAKVEGEIVGCGVLVREENEVGRIVRMSVSSEHQRTGIGTRLLWSLLERAKALGYKEIVLETTAVWESAVAFYRGHGFIPTEVRGDDQHFRLSLEATT